jgi:hypothetical protein
VTVSYNLLRAGGTFLGWGGDCPFVNTPSVTFSMGSDRRCTATFSNPPTQRLTVTRLGHPDSQVLSTPVGIDCGTACVADFNRNQTVRLSAQLGAGRFFLSWIGCDSRPPGINPWPDCEIAMNADRQVTLRVE